MSKIVKLEKVTGVVALAYLAIIPAALYVGYRKLLDLDADVQEMWDSSTTAENALRVPIFSLRNRLLPKKQ